MYSFGYNIHLNNKYLQHHECLCCFPDATHGHSLAASGGRVKMYLRSPISQKILPAPNISLASSNFDHTIDGGTTLSFGPVTRSALPIAPSIIKKADLISSLSASPESSASTSSPWSILTANTRPIEPLR